MRRKSNERENVLIFSALHGFLLEMSAKEISAGGGTSTDHACECFHFTIKTTSFVIVSITNPPTFEY